MPNPYVTINKVTAKISTLTLTTNVTPSTLTDSTTGLFSAFPFNEDTLRFGSTGEATTFMTSIGATTPFSTFTVGTNFQIRAGASGDPQEFGGATFTRTNNEIVITGIDVTGLTLASSINLFFQTTGQPLGTMTATVGGKEFSTDVVGTPTLAASALKDLIDGDAGLSASSSAGVVTVTGDATSGNFSTSFASGGTSYSGAFATTTSFGEDNKYFFGVREIEHFVQTGVVTAKDSGGTDIPHNTGEILTVNSSELGIDPYTKP